MVRKKKKKELGPVKSWPVHGKKITGLSRTPSSYSSKGIQNLSHDETTQKMSKLRAGAA